MMFCKTLSNLFRITKVESTRKSSIAARTYAPTPMVIPIAAVTQIVEAVVIPLTVNPSFNITPAPRKPIPVTMLDATLS